MGQRTKASWFAGQSLYCSIILQGKVCIAPLFCRQQHKFQGQKSRLWETPNLSTDADSSTNTFVSAGVKKGADSTFLFFSNFISSFLSLPPTSHLKLKRSGMDTFDQICYSINCSNKTWGKKKKTLLDFLCNFTSHQTCAISFIPSL